MAKATSSFMARKKSQLAKYRKLDAASYATREMVKENEVKNLEVQLQHNAEAYKTFGVFKDLAAYTSSDLTVARLLQKLDDNDLVSDLDVYKMLTTEVPDILIEGDEYVETITSIRGISIDATKFWNYVHVKFAGKLSKLPRVLVLGLDTDMPGEVYGYDGPAPSETTPGLHTDSAAIYYRIPGVRGKRAQTFRESVLNYLDAQYMALRELFQSVCRDALTMFELKEAPTQGMDLTELLVMQQGAADEERDKNFQRPDRIARQAMKGGGTHFHESHSISSNTTEASAEAIANVMIEYAFGKVYLSEPEDGQRRLLLDKLGLADVVHNIEDENLRRCVRLIAFLDRYNSMKKISVNYDPRGNRDEQVTKMSGHEIAKEWEPNTVDRIVAIYKEHGLSDGSKFIEIDSDNWRNGMTIARMVMDGFVEAERETVTHTEFVSHDEFLSRRMVEKALNIYYKTLRAIKEQIIEDEVRLDVKSLALRQGPLLENGEFVHKLVQHPASSGLSGFREITEVKRGEVYKYRRVISAAQGCYVPVKVTDTMTKFLDRTEILPKLRDAKFQPIGESYEIAEDYPEGKTWDEEHPDYQYAVFPVTVTYTDPLQIPEPTKPVIQLPERAGEPEDNTPLDLDKQMLIDLLYELERADELAAESAEDSDN